MCPYLQKCLKTALERIAVRFQRNITRFLPGAVCLPNGCIMCMWRDTNYSMVQPAEEGRKETFYLTTHSTHFILRLYGVGHMIKDHSDSERGNSLPPHGLLFSINSKEFFICTISQTG